MKTILLVLLAVLVSFSSGFALSAETLTIAYLDYCPHTCDPEKEDGRIGYVAEVVQTIFSNAGIEIVFEKRPWKRALVYTENGLFDGMLCGNSAHSDSIIYSKEVIAVLQQNFYIKKGNLWRYEGVESLENTTIGSVLGYNYSALNQEFQDYLQENKETDKVSILGGATAPLRNFKNILLGRITTFNEDAGLFAYITSRAGIKEQFEVAGSLGDNPQYMAFSPHNEKAQQYIEIIDNGMKEMRENGQLKLILDKYGLDDWKEMGN